MEIDVARRIDDERQKIIDKISEEAQERHRLKDAEKEKQMTDMRKQIEDLKRKAEQGSQKMQGEILELDLEDALRREFPFDIIDSVAPGIRGADIVQAVKRSPAGNAVRYYGKQSGPGTGTINGSASSRTTSVA